MERKKGKICVNKELIIGLCRPAKSQDFHRKSRFHVHFLELRICIGFLRFSDRQIHPPPTNKKRHQMSNMEQALAPFGYRSWVYKEAIRLM